jgi:hypothetical protein
LTQKAAYLWEKIDHSNGIQEKGRQLVKITENRDQNIGPRCRTTVGPTSSKQDPIQRVSELHTKISVLKNIPVYYNACVVVVNATVVGLFFS